MPGTLSYARATHLESIPEEHHVLIGAVDAEGLEEGDDLSGGDPGGALARCLGQVLVGDGQHVHEPPGLLPAPLRSAPDGAVGTEEGRWLLRELRKASRICWEEHITQSQFAPRFPHRTMSKETY